MTELRTRTLSLTGLMVSFKLFPLVMISNLSSLTKLTPLSSQVSPVAVADNSASNVSVSSNVTHFVVTSFDWFVSLYFASRSKFGARLSMLSAWWTILFEFKYPRIHWISVFIWFGCTSFWTGNLAIHYLVKHHSPFGPHWMNLVHVFFWLIW